MLLNKYFNLKIQRRCERKKNVEGILRQALPVTVIVSLNSLSAHRLESSIFTRPYMNIRT